MPHEVRKEIATCPFRRLHSDAVRTRFPGLWAGVLGGAVEGIGVPVGWRRWAAVLVQVRSRGGKGKVAGGAAREWMVGVMSAAFSEKTPHAKKKSLDC